MWLFCVLMCVSDTAFVLDLSVEHQNVSLQNNIVYVLYAWGMQSIYLFPRVFSRQTHWEAHSASRDLRKEGCYCPDMCHILTFLNLDVLPLEK